MTDQTDTRAQHEHELELRRIAARQENKRRVWLGWVLVGVALVMIFGGTVGCITWSAQQDRKTAQLCIRGGSIWISGNCIPIRKQ